MQEPADVFATALAWLEAGWNVALATVADMKTELKFREADSSRPIGFMATICATQYVCPPGGAITPSSLPRSFFDSECI